MRPDAAQAVQEIRLSIATHFTPVGFQIPATPHQLPLQETPGPLIRRLPLEHGEQPRYGLLRLDRGQYFSLMVDEQAGGMMLYVDRNRNGDLRDDGKPLKNRGHGLFAAALELPFPLVSGAPQLQGAYALWLFVTEADRRTLRLQYYCLTQLRGQLDLAGTHYDIWLADNLITNANYRDDGLYIDLDQNGRVDSPLEWVPPGRVLQLAKRSYRFSIAP